MTRPLPPAGGTPKDFVLPVAEIFTLGNGMTVTLVPWGSIPKATVSLVLRAGSLNERPDEVWLAELVGDLLQEGTLSRGAREVAEAAAGMGGSVKVATGFDQTGVTGDVLAEAAPDMVRLLAEMVRHPRLPESELPRLRQDRLRELAVARQQPDQLALEAFRQALHGDHPYGRLFPTEAMLTGFTIGQARGFYETNFGARRARLYVAGRFDPAAVRVAAEEAFGEWAPGPEPLVLPPAVRARRELLVVDRPGAPQSTLIVGTPVFDPTHPDWVRLLVANALLGGSFASRITSNIREEKGWTYSPASTVSVRYRDAYWAESADVTTAATGQSLGEIFREIERLGAEAPPEEELDGIRNYVAGTFVLQNSTRQGIIGLMTFLGLHGLPESYLQTYVRTVHGTTPADVSRLVHEFLVPGRMLIAVTGDRAAIADQLAPWAPVESPA
ncbi:MAG TPA: pitrilysin family protein [Gemmatimonadales bacterium]|nr:pitrilysin family protein [Gemmatimonadales bacterium]